ncbi:MAG TPA: hypothetical protein VJ986_02760 [Gaiellaceae bacterium]|nr:hypothetical protein [Gaiellaceae bacterium]
MWKHGGVAGLAILAVAALVAGCGGGGGGGGSKALTKAQYEQRVQADGKSLEQAITAISSNMTSLAELKSAVAKAQTGLKKAANDLESLTPPKEAEQANATFVTALRAIDKQLGALKTAADKGDMAAVLATVQGLATSKEAIAAQKAAASLKKLGYDLGVLGG